MDYDSLSMREQVLKSQITFFSLGMTFPKSKSVLTVCIYIYVYIYMFVCNVMSCHVMSCHVMSCHVMFVWRFPKMGVAANHGRGGWGFTTKGKLHIPGLVIFFPFARF